MNPLKLRRLNDEGVSPVIATILMVAITVVLAATVYVWVSGFGAQGTQAKSLSVSQLSCTTGTSGNVKFTVVSVSPNFASGALAVKDNGNRSLNVAGLSNPISAGDVMTLTPPTGSLLCTEVLNFIDKGSNTVVATVTLHP